MTEEDGTFGKKVMIVILNYITYQLTLSLVKEIKEKLIYDSYDILVVDNASPNESAKILKERADKEGYIFLKNEENGGYAKGNNIGIRYAIKEGYLYTWILNNDVKITDRYILEKLVVAMQKFSNVGITGPKIIDINENVVPPYVNRLSLWDMTLGIVNTKKSRYLSINSERNVYRVYGCCMLLRNNMMKQIDCMDERTFLYCEEEILAERLRKIGGIVYYVPSTQIMHMESMTVKKVHRKNILKKLKIVLSSFDLYLREYRKFGIVSRFFCKLVRGTIIVLRG